MEHLALQLGVKPNDTFYHSPPGKTVLKDIVQLDQKIQPPLQLALSLSSTLERPPTKSQRNAVNAHKKTPFFSFGFYLILKCSLFVPGGRKEE